MTTHDYLIEMTFAPFGTLLTPAEVAAFSERMVLPTFAACAELQASGRIVAGGTALAAGGFIFIARASSPDELEEMLATLPLWPRAQVRVVPLGRFDARAARVRRRLEQAQPRAFPVETAAA